MDCRLKEPDSRAWQVVLASAFFILLGLSALSAVLDDVPYDTVMWDPLDPFGFAALSNASALASAALPSAGTAAGLRAEWVEAVPGYDDIGHLRISDAASDDSVYLGPYGFGQWRYADVEFYPGGVDRFVSWADVAVRADIADASNNLSGVIGAIDAAGVGALPSAGTVSGLAVEWKTNVYPETDKGHLRIFDPINFNEILLNPHGFGQWRTSDPEYPDGIDSYVPWADLATAQELAAALAPLATTQQVAEAVSGAVTNLNLYAVPAAGGKHELWVKE